MNALSSICGALLQLPTGADVDGVLSIDDAETAGDAMQAFQPTSLPRRALAAWAFLNAPAVPWGALASEAGLVAATNAAVAALAQAGKGVTQEWGDIVAAARSVRLPRAVTPYLAFEQALQVGVVQCFVCAWVYWMCLSGVSAHTTALAKPVP